MVSSILNEGVRGLQVSQRDMVRTAQDIARHNVPAQQTSSATTPRSEEALFAPASATENTRMPSIEASLVELRRQEQVFTANAKVVAVANETLGSVIDIQS